MTSPQHPKSVAGINLDSLNLLTESNHSAVLEVHTEFLNRLNRALGSAWLSLPQTVLELRWRFTPAGTSEPHLAFALFAVSDKPEDAFESLRLMGTHLDEYQTSPMGVAEIEAWRSCDIRQATMLRRKTSSISLEAMEDPLGGEGIITTDVWSPGNFVSHGADWGRALKTITTCQTLFTLCVRFNPTQLLETERTYLGTSAWLANNVHRRDKTSLMGEQAGQWFKHVIAWTDRLSRGAAVVTITIGSPVDLPATLINTIGGLLSSAERNDTLLHSGFEVVRLESDANASAIHAFQSFTNPPLPMVPNAPHDAGRLPYLFDSSEASSAMLLPPSPTRSLAGVKTRSWRSKPLEGTRCDGIQIGTNRHGNHEKPVTLSLDDLRRHALIIGQTGTGKTTLLQNTTLEAIRHDFGAVVFDVHGDMTQWLLERIPANRVKDVIVIDPCDPTHSIGLNPFEGSSVAEAYQAAKGFSHTVRQLMTDKYGPKALEYQGPRQDQHIEMNSLMLALNEGGAGTILQLVRVFQEDGFYKKFKLPENVQDSLIRNWVEQSLPKQSYTEGGSDNFSLGEYISNKLLEFVFDPRVRDIFGQARSTINFEEAMDDGKIVLIKLSRGILGADNAAFLGRLIKAKLMSALLARANRPEGQRREVLIVTDEWSKLASDADEQILSEGRKFGAMMLLATQFLEQVGNERAIKAALGNAGTVVAFRSSLADARHLEPTFAPEVSIGEMVNLPNFMAYVRASQSGQITPAFTLEVQPGPDGNSRVAERIIAESRHKYARDRNEIELEIAASLERAPLHSRRIKTQASRTHEEKLTILRDSLKTIDRNPFEIGGTLIFSHGDAVFKLDTSPTDHDYVRLLVEDFGSIDFETDAVPWLRHLSDLNHRFKVAKIYEHDGDVSASIELFLPNMEDFQSILERCLNVHHNIIKEFKDGPGQAGARPMTRIEDMLRAMAASDAEDIASISNHDERSAAD